MVPISASENASPPTLIIVMGTSGSGKSTLGASLARDLGVPFIDGDDLHPKENVDKMSRGEPLQDSDREGWLKTIRARAWEVVGGTRTGETAGKLEEEGSEEQRRLAEVFETSKGEGVDHPRQVQDIKEEAVAAADQGDNQLPTMETSSTHSPSPPSIVIACSALKGIYRSLLRGEIDSLPTSSSTTTTSSSSSPPTASTATGTSSPSPEQLRTIHVYVSVTPEELLRRMHARKGHFMKESMLKSQLDTLEIPREDQEEGIVVIQDGPAEEVEKRTLQRIRALLA